MSRLLWAAAAVGVLVVPSCGGGDEVTIREDRTRILDDESREALQAVDENGTLRFSPKTSQVAAFAPGHIIVSEPTDAAPYGLCRKITSVTDEGDALVAETELGMLYEVIENGSFDVSAELEPVDLAEILPLEPGSPAMKRIPDTHYFRVPVSIVLEDLDGNHATTDDQLRIDGSITFDPQFNVSWKVSFDSGGLFDDLNPFDSIELSITISIDLHEDATIGVVVPAGKQFAVDKQVARYPFTPITFAIGPVPVTITPVAVVEAGFAGEAKFQPIEYGAHQFFTARVGARCSSNNGCGPIASIDNDFDTFGGTLQHAGTGYQSGMSAYARVSLDLLIYGVVGPYGALEPRTTLFVQVPGDPAWRLQGGIRGLAGLKISPLGLSWDAEVFNEDWTIGESENHAPRVRFPHLSDGAEVQLNQPLLFQVSAEDLEEGIGNCCTVTVESLPGGEAITRQGGLYAVTFQTAGSHTISATAVDAHGLSASASVDIEVVNTPPDATIGVPDDGASVSRDRCFWVQGSARDPNEPGGALDCAAVVWSGADEVGDFSNPDLCSADEDGFSLMRLSSGPRTISLTATDPQGASDTDQKTVSVVAPAADEPPNVTIKQPLLSDGETALVIETTGSGHLTLKVAVDDPDDPSVPFSWTARWYCSGGSCADSAVVDSGTLTGIDAQDCAAGVLGATRTTEWDVWSTLPFPSSCGAQYRGELVLRVDADTGAVSKTIPLLVRQPAC